MYLIPIATLRSSLPQIGSPVVSSLSERGGGREEEEEEEDDDDDDDEEAAGLEVTKPLDLQSSATSLGSSIASLPLPEIKVIPGGGSEASGLPLRKDSRPESGDGDGEEEEEEVEQGAMSTTTWPFFPPIVVEFCGRTRGSGALQFGVAALDVVVNPERVTGQRSAPRSAIARRKKKSQLFSSVAR